MTWRACGKEQHRPRRPGHRTLVRLAALLAAVALAKGCGDGDAPTEPPPPDLPRATTITVSPATADLAALGATVQLSAQVQDQNGQAMAGAAVTWASSAAAVAAVSTSGLVTAVANGSATITATSGSASGSATVTVAQSVSLVAVTSDTASFGALGDTVRLSAEAFDANGSAVAGAEFSWESSDESVATVDASGLVTAVANGSATITATSGSASGSAAVTVAQAVSSVAVTPDAARLGALGDTVRLSAGAFDANGHAMAGTEFSWESSDEAVAAVDGSGLVTAAGNGTATITATSDSASGSATVTVAQDVSAVTVTPATDTVVAGDTLRLVAEATDASGHPVAGAELSWASGDTTVATVDPSGLVTGVAAGEVEIAATSSGVTGRAALAVADPVPAAVVVTPDTVLLSALGQTAQLAAEVRDQIGRIMEGSLVVWSSADTNVAAVDTAGLVTAIGGGATTITATAGEVSVTAVVTVTQSARSVVVSPAADTVAPGDTLRLAAEAFDANGHAITGAVFEWSSPDTAVAVVDAVGLVTGVGAGEVEITATAGGGGVSGNAAVRVMKSAQACAVTRSLALRHDAQFGNHGVVREWDGTPFRVDMVRNFPEFVTDADLQRLLDPVGRLADQIETQLGYRIVEMGGLVEVPSGAAVGWDQRFDQYFQSHRLRERGQILVFYMNDDNPQDWDGRGGAPMSAHPCCGTITYNKRTMGPWWTDDDPCCKGNANGRNGETLVHELFHLLGFKHAFNQPELVGVKMSRDGLDSPWTTGSRIFYATRSDVDNLRCIFPEGG